MGKIQMQRYRLIAALPHLPLWELPPTWLHFRLQREALCRRPGHAYLRNGAERLVDRVVSTFPLALGAALVSRL